MPNTRPLPKDLEEIARTQLNEDPKRLEDDLKHIKEWLSKQPHITARTDDQTLVAFLRGCKYSLERAKEKLDFYYTVRTTLPDYFTNRDPLSPNIQRMLELAIMLPLPEPDDLGRRVILLRVGVYDASEIKAVDLFRLNFMMVEMMLQKDDRGVIAGIVSVLDMTGVTFAHAAQMTPTVVKHVMKVSQDAYPIRPKGINYIHTPPTFDAVFNLFKSFTKDKLKKRLYVHGDDVESLYRNVPQRILPKEYGGNAGPINEIAQKFKKEMESYRDWFMEDSKFKTDESKRPGKPKTYEDLFGMEGSFRQLSVD